MIMNVKLFIGVLASSIVPLITSIASTITAHVQLSNKTDLDGIIIQSVGFTSSYVTFVLFIGFLVVVNLAALKFLKNVHLIITLTFLDGALMVAGGANLNVSMRALMVVAGANLNVSMTVGYNMAGFGMFIGATVLLLVKIFHILPLTFQLLTKGISLWNTRNKESMLRKYLPFAIYGELIFGLIASLVYTVAALAVTVKWYTHPDPDPDRCYYSPANKFQYSLPLFIFLQMTVAMVFFVQFKWKWGARAFAFLSSFLLVVLGYALNTMTVELYTNNDSGSDFQKVLHNGDIYMTVASFFMILITIFVNMAWPVLYNLRNPTGNKETVIELAVLHNPTANEDMNSS